MDDWRLWLVIGIVIIAVFPLKAKMTKKFFEKVKKKEEKDIIDE